MTKRIVPWDVLRIHRPLSGIYTMLELGTGRGLGGETYKAYYEGEGIACTSVRPSAVLNGHGGNVGRFDLVSNVAASEYVNVAVHSQGEVWKLICESAVQVIVSVTALPNSPGGGYHRPTEEFYRRLATLNGLSVDRLYETNNRRGRVLCVRLTRIREAPPFRMPDEALIKPGQVRTMPGISGARHPDSLNRQ